MPLPSGRSALAVVLLAPLLTLGCAPSTASDAPRDTPSWSAGRSSTVAWPDDGQASYAMKGQVFSSPGQHPVPIASLAKVMTAYVTVDRLARSSHLVVGPDDVAETDRRRRRGESVVAVAHGEVLDRDQALTALLLPSANNIAVMLADRVAGSRSGFVELMNETAEALGMADTTYTDPSGLATSTVSTARDQLLLLRAALRVPELARLMGLPSAVLPVAGRVHNTNRLLGQDGFVAGKTGSTIAAGGCLVFRVTRGGVVMDGVVLGQRGGPLTAAALRAAMNLAGQAFGA